MTKDDLIFDWKESESRGRDKLFAFFVVALLFAGFAGWVETGLPAYRNTPAEAAALIRFADGGMARSWLLEAEESGPFPGRLQLDDKGVAEMVFDGGRLDAWTDYRGSMRPLPGGEAVGRVQITPKGKRVFPPIPGVPAGMVIPPRGEIRRIPILIPYDRFALGWMPEDLPAFTPAAGADIPPDSLRFAMSLRKDGSVVEAIPLAGGEDPGQEAIRRWLLGVRFEEGADERWFGLRVEFVNRREDATQPE
jgi:hypothetical protein